ncbi:MAG TPA: polysaccharide deacetylase family protein [Terriglobales bacterium]|nr:polysaccharide deacetylase family protein [Terriglobales bacterium]
MRVFSPLLKRVVYPGLSRTGYFRRRKQLAPAVLTYHGLLPQGYTPRDIALDGHLVSDRGFRAQIQLLKTRYSLIPPEQFRAWLAGGVSLPPRSVLLTCDDGLLNTLTDMLPILRELDVPMLFFVTGASTRKDRSMLWYEQLYLWLIQAKAAVELRAPWRRDPYRARGSSQIRFLWRELMRRLSKLEEHARAEALDAMRIQIGISRDWQAEYSQNEPMRRRFFMLNASDVEELGRAGITIGAHTLSHPMLSRMSGDTAYFEVSESRSRLQKLLGREVWAMAYPFGNDESVSARDQELASRAGYECAFMNDESSPPEQFSLPRIHVTSEMSCAELEAHLSGFHGAVRGKFLRLWAGMPA